MKINEFVGMMKTNKNMTMPLIKKTLDVKSYIPVIRKRKLAEIVYNTSTAVKDGVVVVDSLSKYLIFTMLMINEYTNLEFTIDEFGVMGNDAVDEYDLLCSNGVLNTVLECFATDYARSNEVLNYVFSDKLAAVNSIEAIFGRLCTGALNSLDKITNSIKGKIDEFELDLSNVDLSNIDNKEISNFLKQLR